MLCDIYSTNTHRDFSLFFTYKDGGLIFTELPGPEEMRN